MRVTASPVMALAIMPLPFCVAVIVTSAMAWPVMSTVPSSVTAIRIRIDALPPGHNLARFR